MNAQRTELIRERFTVPALREGSGGGTQRIHTGAGRLEQVKSLFLQ